MNKRVELDVPDELDPLSPTATSVLSCTKCLPLFGDRLRRFHGETIFSMT